MNAWRDFHESTGFDDARFADKVRYSDLVNNIHPCDFGTLIDFVQCGDRVGIVPGNVWWYGNKNEILKAVPRNVGSFLRRTSRGFPGEYRGSSVLWSSSSEDFFFVSALSRHFSWRSVNRNRCRSPFGVIRVRLDERSKTFRPTSWKYKQAYGWVLKRGKL